MKLIIQIACLNEEENLIQTLDDLPKSLPRVNEIEVLIIDDGSIDQTSQVARDWGVDYILRFPQNKGLAHAFHAGLLASVKLGADIIVHTDADNQYDANCTLDLINPILDGNAEIVVGNRPIDEIKDFSFIKRKLQKIGSFVVRLLSRTEVKDATSGFRAYSKYAAIQLTRVSDFTYTIETLIQAGQRRLCVKGVDIKINPPTRTSRLFRSVNFYVIKSTETMIRIMTQVKPLATYIPIGVVSILFGLVPSFRFLYYLYFKNEAGHIQSLILACMLILFGGMCLLVGLLADQISGNRKILEQVIERVRILDIKAFKKDEPDIPFLVYQKKEN